MALTFKQWLEAERKRRGSTSVSAPNPSGRPPTNGVYVLGPAGWEVLESDISGEILRSQGSGQAPIWAPVQLSEFDADIASQAELDAEIATRAAADAAHLAALDPHAQYQREAEKGQANGYASLDGNTKVPTGQIPALAGTYRGAWQAATDYKVRDLVVQANKLYQANADFTSAGAFNAGNWTLVPIASSGYKGAWQAATAYNQNELVTQGGALYAAIADFVSAGAFNGANWNLVVAAGPQGLVGPDAPLGLRTPVPCTTCLMDPTYVAEGGASGHNGATYKRWVTALIDTVPGTLKLTYTNAGLLGVNGGSTITVKAAIIKPDGTIVNVTWDAGAANKVCNPGAAITSDAVTDLALVAGDKIAILTYVTSNVAGVWPHQNLQTANGFVQYDVDKTDNTGNWTAAASPNAYGPTTITAVATRRVRAVALYGDSQLAQSTDNNFLETALQAGNVPTVRFASSGDTLDGLNTPARQFGRQAVSFGCSDAVSEIGTNDESGGKTAAQMKASWLTAWGSMRTVGFAKRVYQLTIPPRDTGTSGAQVVVASNAVRIDCNDWLRAGAPIDPGTLAAVAVGTAGALLAGQPNHPLTDYMEWADVIETFRNSGFQRAAYFSDGVHFNGAGYGASAAAFGHREFGSQQTKGLAVKETRNWRKGNYLYPPNVYGTLQSKQLVNRRLYLRPFIHEAGPRVPGSLYCYMPGGAASAGGVGRLLIYKASDADGLPGKLMWDAGTFDATVIGTRNRNGPADTLTADQDKAPYTLQPGDLYYIGVDSEGGAATQPFLQSGVGPHPLVSDQWFPGAAYFGYLRSCYAYDLAADAAPADLSGVAPVGNETFCPLVFYKS